MTNLLNKLAAALRRGMRRRTWTKFSRRLKRRIQGAWLAAKSPRLIILLRYSILQDKTANFRQWRLSRVPFEEYRAALFDDRRLESRLRSFVTLVLPSLAVQSAPMHPRRQRVVIVTSTELPAHHMAQLREAIAPYPWAEIVTCPPDRRPDYRSIVDDVLKSMAAPPGLVVTARLDDDDALGRRYVEKLGVYVRPENEKKAISFATGYLADYDSDTGKISTYRKARIPFVAAGVAYIERYDGRAFTGKTIFKQGQHFSLPLNNPHIVDDTFPAWVRTVYPGQDTGGAIRLDKREIASPRDVAKNFPAIIDPADKRARRSGGDAS